MNPHHILHPLGARVQLYLAFAMVVCGSIAKRDAVTA